MSEVARGGASRAQPHSLLHDTPAAAPSPQHFLLQGEGQKHPQPQWQCAPTPRAAQVAAPLRAPLAWQGSVCCPGAMGGLCLLQTGRRFVPWEERMGARAEWRSGTVAPGGQCATTPGTCRMLRWHAGSWAAAPQCLLFMRLRLGRGQAPSGWSRWSAGVQSHLCRTAGPGLETVVPAGIRRTLVCAAPVSGRAGTPHGGIGKEPGQAFSLLGPRMAPELLRARPSLQSMGAWCQVGSSLCGAGCPPASAHRALQPPGPSPGLPAPYCPQPRAGPWALSRPP